MKVAHIIEAEGSNNFHFPFSTHIMQIIIEQTTILQHLIYANDEFHTNNANDN